MDLRGRSPRNARCIAGEEESYSFPDLAGETQSELSRDAVQALDHTLVQCSMELQELERALY